MKDSSNDIITPIQTSKTFFNNNTPETVSKKESGIKQLEESANVIHSGEAFDGYNLFQFRDYSNGRYNFRITDMDGNIIDEFPSRNTYGHCYPINSTTFLLSGGNPMYFWNRETGRNRSFNFSSHHDVSYNPKTKTFISLGIQFVIDSGYSYRYDTIREITKDGNIIWNFNTSSFIPFDWWTREMSGVNRDITHSNTVFWDMEEDMIYLNCRNLNTFFKIDHSTGQVVWGLGKHGDFILYDQYGNQRQNLFYYAHALEKVDDDTFILFDNRWYNETTSTRSRILEITIDETSMTANESWVWTGPSDYYSYAWSDADRLPNGNRFGAFGYIPDPRLVEVNESGDIVWEMHYTGGSLGVYSADRYRLNPTLSNPEDKLIENGNPITISWQTWYNFRTKLKMKGSYVLYKNGNAIDDGEVVFDKFWRPTNLSFDFNSLKPGEYNLTLVVKDEGGHTTKDSVSVTTQNIAVFREGPSQIELGQENAIIQWTGASVSPLMGEIYDNNTFLNTFTWNGSKIELDLNSLTLGKHNITFQIWNDSEELCYSDIFWVTIYHGSSPEIFSFPQDQTMAWDNYSVLSWEIFDISPNRWTLLINDTIYQFEEWDQPYFQINWNRPTLDEAIFNITLILTDQLGYQTILSTWLSIISPEKSIVIIKTPLDTIQWGQKNTLLVWEVQGATNWSLWRNDTLLRSGVVVENYIEVLIDKWQYEDWRLGTYNLTMHLIDDKGASVTRTNWIKLYLGDEHANSVVSEVFILFPENALGPPDNVFANVVEDYFRGYITIDMGTNEEIIDGKGNDFAVIAQGGEYNVFVSNDFGQSFTSLGGRNGNQSFDLGTVGITSARYVKIECNSSDSVYLDAIVAFNCNSPEGDLESPYINGPNYLWVHPDETSTSITWESSDLTPWNYSIFVNDLMVESGPWNGSDIIFIFSLPTIIETQVSLILYDIFGNSAKASVIIKIYEINDTGSSSTTKPTSTRANYSMIGLLLGLGILIALRINRKH
ncbi:MAG: aryl-sulfate sulfotransferase [Candidatus Hodarchaeales archaeon]